MPKQWTPWGTADAFFPVIRGVRFLSTPSHGGLAVAKGVASKLLSDAARYAAEYANGYYWFEEDCKINIALYEHPEWQGMFLKTLTKEELRERCTFCDQVYLDNYDSGWTIGRIPEVGDFVKIIIPQLYPPVVLQKDRVFQVKEITASCVKIWSDRRYLYCVSYQKFFDKEIEILDTSEY